MIFWRNCFIFYFLIFFEIVDKSLQIKKNLRGKTRIKQLQKQTIKNGKTIRKLLGEQFKHNTDNTKTTELRHHKPPTNPRKHINIKLLECSFHTMVDQFLCLKKHRNIKLFKGLLYKIAHKNVGN